MPADRFGLSEQLAPGGVQQKALEQKVQERIQTATAAANGGGGAGALKKNGAPAMEASIAGILRRGLYDDLHIISTRLGAGDPVPAGYAALTIAAAIASGAVVFWVVDRLGIESPLATATALVLGGVGIDIVAEKLAQTDMAKQAHARFQAKAKPRNPAAPPPGAEPVESGVAAQ
jgi:hypothetical protein